MYLYGTCLVMRLKGVYYKRSWETIHIGNDLFEEDNTEALVYHYWLYFEEVCIYFSPLDANLYVCDMPPGDAKRICATQDAMIYEAMHTSFYGAKLENILDCRDGELMFFFLFDNDSRIYIERFWGTMSEPVRNSYWRLYFETPAANPDGVDWLLPHCKIISVENIYDKRNKIGEILTP